MLPEPITPLILTRKGLLVIRAILLRDGEEADVFEIGRGDFECTAINLVDRKLHIALSAQQPDIPNEDILQLDRLGFALDDQRSRLGTGRQGRQFDFPRPVGGSGA